MIELIKKAAHFIQQQGFDNPEAGIILGTGLGHFIREMEVVGEIDYGKIPGFPVSTVEFHKGKLIFGHCAGKFTMVMLGRFHIYEGYTQQQITFPIRVMKRLGIRNLLISNAGGALNPAFKKSSLMLIDDHINLLGSSPLAGKNFRELGPRFPDMSEPYSPFLNHKLEQIASSHQIKLHKGVYVAVPGPNLETRAEYRFLRGIGADVVGMSTIPEVIVANHMNLPCAAVSVITDECDPDNLQPVDIDDILKTAAEAEKDLIVLFRELIRQI